MEGNAVHKILIADDEPNIREIIKRVLAEDGREIIEADNGASAYEAVCSRKPDLTLLDVWMPGMDGFEVLRRLRENPATKTAPVILMTSLAAVQGEAAGRRLGVNHYIMKPLDLDSVALAVRVALRESRHLRPKEILHLAGSEQSGQG